MRTKSKTQAFVLRKKALPGKDYFVVLFTKEFGKVHCIAKGTRSMTSRRSPHLQTGNLLDVLLQQSFSGYMLQETTLTTAFRKTKEDLGKINHLYTYFFVLDKMLAEELPEGEIYQLTMKFLTVLSENDEFSLQETFMFLKRLLYYLGYEYSGSTSELVPYIEELIDTKIPLRDIM